VTGNIHPLRRQKTRRCMVKGCRQQATQWSGLYAWCCPEHGALLVKQIREREAAAKAKAEAKLHRERKEAIRPRGKVLADVQRAFNAYIRERDKGLPCISCGRPDDGLHQRHAGHFLSVGSHPALRFDPDNCHAQCSVCNNHLSGNIHGYRPSLIARIGEDRVARLEGPHPPAKWSREELTALRSHYRAAVRRQQSGALPADTQPDTMTPA
jgi:hypothetical protein